MTVSAILHDPAYPALKDHVLSHTGLNYYEGKDEDFAARLSRRFTARRVSSCATYLKQLTQRSLADGPSELDALVSELTIGETYFFRQTEHFELLRTTIIPELLERNRDSRQLRIWSAGCAIGAEPYSVAMVLWPEFAAQLFGWEVLLLGTDINLSFLDQARSGEFSQWHLRDLPGDQRNGCFTQEGNRWRLNDEIRNRVEFRYHNLTDSETHPAADGQPFDLIFCRNVIIYFAEDRIRELSQEFYTSLKPGGWLVLGHAEYSTELFSRFNLMRNSGAAVYRRPLESAEQPEPFNWQSWSDRQPVWPEYSASHLPTGVEQQKSYQAPAEGLEDARRMADRGQIEEAAAICNRLLAADSLDAPAYFTLGLILEHSGASEEAIGQLKKAIYVDRSFALAHYHLGTVLRKSGDVAGARKAFANAMELVTRLPPDELVAHGDGIRVEELRQMAAMHSELSGKDTKR